MNQKTKIFFVIVVVALLVASRLVKHPFNFSPIIAVSIFAGFYLKKYWAVALPLVAMVISDYFIGFYDWQIMASVYLSIALAFLIGRFLVKHKKWYNIIFSAVTSSILFFLITNFAVWAFFDWYPHTWSGLISNFTLAIPFFRNSFIGDLVYTSALFGIFEFSLFWADRKFKVNNELVAR